MTYHSARTQRNTRYARIFLFTAFVFALLFAWGYIKKILYPVALPVASTYASVRDTSTGIPHAIITYFTSRHENEVKIETLETNIERLENELALAREIGTTTDLGTTTAHTLKPLASNIKTVELYPIVRDITTLYNTVVLSKGFVDGIEEGSIVYVRGNQAVGYIAEVHKTTSTMRLYSSADQKVEGVIKDIDTSVTLIGQGGGSYIIEVPKTIAITVGQNVYLSGAQNMILGVVVEVKNDPQDTFTKAYIRGAYSPTRAHIFYVNQ